MRRRLEVVSMALVCAWTGVACVSIGQVERVALAGSRYAETVDHLVAVTQEVSVDADSVRLLDQMPLDARNRQTVYDQHDGIRELTETIGKLRAHARLLQTYFEALNALATSDAPARARNAAQGAATALNALGTELRGAPILTAEDRDALALGVQLAVTTAQRALIVQELRERAQLIGEQLRLETVLVKALGRKLAADRRTLATLGMQREVEAPYLAGEVGKSSWTASDRAWVARRRTYVIAESGLGALDDAAQAGEKMERAWAALVNNEFDEVAFNDLLEDLEQLTAFAEAVVAASDQP